MQCACKERPRSCLHTGAMPDRVFRGLRSVLLAVAVIALVIVGRAILDQLVGPRGRYVLLFAGVFVTARYAGLRLAIAVALVVAASRFVVPAAVAPDGTVDPTAMLDVTLDLIAGAAAIAMFLVVEGNTRRLRASDLTAETRAGVSGPARPARRCRPEPRPGVGDPAVRPPACRPLRAPRPLGGRGRGRGSPRGAAEQRAGRQADRVTRRSPWTEAAGRRLGGALGRGGGAHRATGPARRFAVVVPLLSGTGSLAVAAIAMPPHRPLDDEELEGLLLLGRIIGEAMARSELNAVSRRDADRALGGGRADRPAPGARRVARTRARRRGHRPAGRGRGLRRDRLQRRRAEPRGRRPGGAGAAACAWLSGGPARARATRAAPREPAGTDRGPNGPLDPRRCHPLDVGVPRRERPARDGGPRPGRRAAGRRAGAAGGAACRAGGRGRLQRRRHRVPRGRR